VDDRRWLWPTLAIILLFVLSYAELGRWLVRFGAAWSDTGEHRLDIWRDALRVSRDFWLTGTGAGSFGRAMLVYQSGDRTLFFNQAHSQYLQVLAEGGLLLAVPALAAGVCLFAGIRRALARDRTATYWLRVGATAGLFGVAVQSLWETGLRMPANAVLCAALAAIALHGRE
jgi:O-antigen ligase